MSPSLAALPGLAWNSHVSSAIAAKKICSFLSPPASSWYMKTNGAKIRKAYGRRFCSRSVKYEKSRNMAYAESSASST